ncbi:MAG: DEAD/DEAH box helicase [Trueperaceae bacterium]|nr:MAG: DEAD/DEAH box helicase [Trueperaceae bacterium]
MTFESFELHARIMAGVKSAGYRTPTPIQRRVIPAALSGRDILGLAQTGTGKTAAFVLPILQRLSSGPRGRMRALIVAPTRELAEQIHGEIRMLGQATRLRSATVYGGVGMAPQIRALRGKGRAEIIVACPGRLLDHMNRGHADLSNLEVLVLDEADHMFDMGFLPDVRTIMKQVPTTAQRLLFSATMPEDVRHLANGVLSDPLTAEIGHRKPAQTVTHALYPVERNKKTEMLKHLLREHDPRSALVFTRTKSGAKRLAKQLDSENFFVTSLQGDLSQSKRQKALDGFRRGDYHILVATDIAARGIDVTRISHVINYDVPNTVEAYTHRIGRTGRAERSGEAFTLVTQDDVKMIRSIERSLGTRLERIELEAFAWDDTFDSHHPRKSRPNRTGVGRRGDGRERSERSTRQTDGRTHNRRYRRSRNGPNKQRNTSRAGQQATREA